MKTRTTLLLALLCAPFVSFGEYEYPSASPDSNEVSISGRILDERSQPLPGATILLDDPLTNTLVKGEVSDPDGLFVFENIPPGKYALSVQFIGYAAYSTDLPLVGGGEVIDLGSITLSTEGTELEEVTVRAKVPFIERKLDRLVVNVESGIIAAGSSAFDVLQRSPGIVISQSDAISLRGKSGVIIMMDGKPSPLSGADLANMLRGLPANAIERIEIITNPSAKYDAAGNAGIIDIRMKKDQRLGANGNITLGAGHGKYPKANAGAGWNYRNKRLNLFGNYNYSYREAFNHLVLYRQFFENGVFTGAYDQDNFLHFDFNTHVLRAGVDFSPSEKTIIGVVANGVRNRFSPTGDNVSDVLGADGKKESSFTTHNDSQDSWNNYSLNANLKQSFGTKGIELSADLDYARFWNQTIQTFTSNYYDLNGEPFLPTYILFGDLAGNLDLKSFKTDYTHPLEGNAKFEAGLKTSLVTADNDVQFFDKSNGQALFDSTKSNHFIYEENLNAAYVNFSKEFEKWSVQLGFRGEQTNAKGDQLVSGERFDTSYVNLFPSGFFNYKLSENHEIGASLSRRLDRPTYKQLNPFKFFLDPSTFSQGNPFLTPQFTWSYELTHTFKQRYVTTLSYSKTLNNITQVIKPDPVQPNVTIQTDDNITSFEYYGATVAATVEPTKWWTSVNNLNVFYGRYTGNVADTQLDDGRVNFNVSSNNTLTLPKGWAGELNFFYQGSQLYAYMDLDPQWQLSLGIQKSLWERRGTIRFNVSDIFWTLPPSADITFTDYKERFDVERETRVANLSFTYRLGKNTVAPSRRRQGGAEEEKRRANG
ncbi:MAG: TonB-dependent receptor [Saprospirales bacterium]|nr:TonB-dependent receptor [Saprospirales bacterium]